MTFMYNKINIFFVLLTLDDKHGGYIECNMML
jgi:hypothetical protein